MNPNDLVYSQSLTRDELLHNIQASMSERRFTHVLGVEEMALKLAELYGGNPEQVSLAALCHDYAKERPDEEMIALIKNQGFDLALLDYGNQIWHGILGAYLAKEELGVADEEVLQAIRLHTTGAKEMTLLDKIIYVADFIEPGRQFPGVEEARIVAFNNLDEAVAYETKQTLSHLIDQEVKIYPKTIETYNQWVVKN
nr:bis(5'-nucleosyl)-tetraphosphatase (symmetrical) YqeK [uncultured Vagococcus sp.]